MQKAQRILSYAAALALAAIFALWAFTQSTTLLGLASAALSCLLFGLVLLRAIPKTVEFFSRTDAPLPDAAYGARSLRWQSRHPWLQIALAFLLFRVLTYIVAYAVYTWENGYSGGILETLQTMWLRTDSPSYLGIAQNGYVTEGDARFHIVFLPLYPLCIRFFMLFGLSAFAAAMLASNLFSLCAAIACYELTALELPFREARAAVRYMLLLPAAFFLAAPMTESLFLFLSLLSLYFARKHRFVLACLCGALSGLTRLQGLLIGLPIACEMAAEIAEAYRAGGGWKRLCAKRAAALFLLLLGPAAYLGANYMVTGDALTFLRYQSEHWNQRMAPFFSAAAYQAEYAFSQEAAIRVQLFIPNLAACFGALLLMFVCVRDMRPSYSLYFLLYFAVSTGASWLLSAPRYLSVAYPLILGSTLLAREPLRDILLSCVYAAAFIAYMGMYVLGGFVY